MIQKHSLVIFTESTYKIGTGHLMESIHLAVAAKKENIRVFLWVNRDAPLLLLRKFRVPYSFSPRLHTKRAIREIKRQLIAAGCKAALFNFRRIDNTFLHSLKFDGLKLICIDELGRCSLDCDAIINPISAEKYHRYPFRNSGPEVYTGTNYLSMSEGFARAHRMKRTFNGPIKNISVCMGGVDRTGATLRLIDILAQWRPEVKKNIILGAAFRHLAAAYRKIAACKGMHFKIYHNVEDVVPLFLDADVVFTAGGNTLSELACLGTPAIVLYEDAHEKESGKAFEKRSFGICVGKGAEVSRKKVFMALEKLEKPEFRMQHSLHGKRLVDGKGAERILGIVRGLLKG